jgi:hypothetical protein
MRRWRATPEVPVCRFDSAAVHQRRREVHLRRVVETTRAVEPVQVHRGPPPPSREACWRVRTTRPWRSPARGWLASRRSRRRVPAGPSREQRLTPSSARAPRNHSAHSLPHNILRRVLDHGDGHVQCSCFDGSRDGMLIQHTGSVGVSKRGRSLLRTLMPNRGRVRPDNRSDRVRVLVEAEARVKRGGSSPRVHAGQEIRRLRALLHQDQQVRRQRRGRPFAGDDGRFATSKRTLDGAIDNASRCRAAPRGVVRSSTRLLVGTCRFTCRLACGKERGGAGNLSKRRWGS